MRVFFLVLFAFWSVNLKAAEVLEHYTPILHQSIWSDVCLKHMIEHAEECSELPTYYDEECDDGYIDLSFDSMPIHIQYDLDFCKEVSDYLSYLPTNSSLCQYSYCKDCNHVVARSFGFMTRIAMKNVMKPYSLVAIVHIKHLRFTLSGKIIIKISINVDLGRNAKKPLSRLVILTLIQVGIFPLSNRICTTVKTILDASVIGQLFQNAPVILAILFLNEYFQL